MFFALIFLAFGVLALAAAGIVLYFRSRQLGKTELMRKVETSRAADVVSLSEGSPVEVKGTLRCAEPLTSEMAERACAYYHSRVIREYQETDRDADGDTSTRRRSQTVASNERFAPFTVEDGSGAVGVLGEGAEVDALEVKNRFERDTGKEGTLSLCGLNVNQGTGERTLGYRYVESVLPVDEPIYVLGVVGNGGIGAPASHEEGSSFIISYRSEEQLRNKYQKDALILALVAAGLSLFGLVFVSVGAASALGFF